MKHLSLKKGAASVLAALLIVSSDFGVARVFAAVVAPRAVLTPVRTTVAAAPSMAMGLTPEAESALVLPMGIAAPVAAAPIVAPVSVVQAAPEAVPAKAALAGLGTAVRTGVEGKTLFDNDVARQAAVEPVLGAKTPVRGSGLMAATRRGLTRLATAGTTLMLTAPAMAMVDFYDGREDDAQSGVSGGSIMHGIGMAAAGIFALVVLCKTFFSVPQGRVAVMTRFGKFTSVKRPGLNVKIPFIDEVRLVSVQNQSTELEFKAITADQANVHFKALLLYQVLNEEEQTIKNVAFKFINEKSFQQTLTRTIEGSVRSFVATKKQAEIQGLRGEIIAQVKQHIDQDLASWGYHLIDLQMNDVSFDEEIMSSMAKVVASNNLRAAATNEGEALKIKQTKEAEARGAAILIAAQAEKDAARLRGEGVALFRAEVAKGYELATRTVSEALVAFGMWTETLRDLAKDGKGNTIFLDGSTEGMQRTMRELQATLSTQKADDTQKPQ